ncbi:hypothetical protein EVAR_99080_1 [Eumeta japonica]|uniref:Uncharacterized protein n=1 Tax=Eumeta variegata TaxID=151549 RepID=A0A4C1ZI71_EUMVA|nr:hypothetical protein EVAR_99080_1 [Eumeta japonica]
MRCGVMLAIQERHARRRPARPRRTPRAGGAGGVQVARQPSLQEAAESMRADGPPPPAPRPRPARLWINVSLVLRAGARPGYELGVGCVRAAPARPCACAPTRPLCAPRATVCALVGVRVCAVCAVSAVCAVCAVCVCACAALHFPSCESSFARLIQNPRARGGRRRRLGIGAHGGRRSLAKLIIRLRELELMEGEDEGVSPRNYPLLDETSSGSCSFMSIPWECGVPPAAPLRSRAAAGDCTRTLLQENNFPFTAE